jgi:hypothetical protein
MGHGALLLAWRRFLVNRRFARRLSRLAAAGALVLASLVLLTGLGPGREAALAATPHTATVTHFVFTASSADTVGDTAYIDNPATNGQYNAMLFVTPNFDPDATCGCVYDPEPVGVWYDDTLKQWAVFNENGADMSQNESFDVLVVPLSLSNHTVFVTESIGDNTVGDYTFISNSTADDNPNAKIQVTQNWDPSGFGNTYNPHPIGVFYDNAAGLWAIFNEDQAPMPTGAYFNVLVNSSVRNGGGKVALQKAAKSNTIDDTTYINNPLTNDNPDNITFVTPNYNPGGKGGTYDPIQTGVWWPSGGSEEGVFNQNGSTPPVHSSYNLLIFPS